jgi:hypothetical protein
MLWDGQASVNDTDRQWAQKLDTGKIGEQEADDEQRRKKGLSKRVNISTGSWLWQKKKLE